VYDNDAIRPAYLVVYGYASEDDSKFQSDDLDAVQYSHRVMTNTPIISRFSTLRAAIRFIQYSFRPSTSSETTPQIYLERCAEDE